MKGSNQLSVIDTEFSESKVKCIFSVKNARCSVKSTCILLSQKYDKIK